MKVCKQINHHRILSCEHSVINGVYCLVLQSNLLFLGRREAAGTQSRLRRDRGDTRGLRRERTLYLWRQVWYLTELNPVASDSLRHHGQLSVYVCFHPLTGWTESKTRKWNVFYISVWCDIFFYMLMCWLIFWPVWRCWSQQHFLYCF